MAKRLTMNDKLAKKLVDRIEKLERSTHILGNEPVDPPDFEWEMDNAYELGMKDALETLLLMTNRHPKTGEKR